MKIIFTTKNIDRKLYEKLTLKYIYEHYYPTDYGRYIEQDKWTIEIKPTTDYDTSFYANDSRAEELDFSIPHGVTGKGNIICYVTDSTNSLILLQNMSVICHELAHMILQIYYPDKVVQMRHNDFHGKAGDLRKFFSCEVHDRVAEGRVRQFEYKLSRWRKLKFIGVDIENLCNTREMCNMGNADYGR
tara:strand:- start:11915 stop:12478 length:564 start_codon:yes stop_codon:yes gene_type:complete